MKRILSILLCLGFSAFSQEVGTNVSGGLSLALGDQAEHMNPGLNASLEPNYQINRIFGVGGHVDYTWISAEEEIEDLRTGFHFIDVGFVPKLYVPLTDDNNMFFEIDPACMFAIGYTKYPSEFHMDSDSDFDTHFALTYGAGFQLGNFLVGMKIKNVHTDPETTNWINLYIGFASR
jgi:hypothetical protein